MTFQENVLWLQGFYRRFDEEVLLLHALEPAWRICKSCPDGNCCQKNSFFSDKMRRNPFLAEDWWRILEQVRDRFSPQDRVDLARNIVSKRKACIFLIKNRCSVYSSRPWSSRIHPYTINFARNDCLFPAGSIELPSCPALAPAFGLKADKEMAQSPQVLERSARGNLVRLKLRKHKPVWMIDASIYVTEFSERSAGKNDSPAEIQQLLVLAKEAGGEYGSLLQVYLEMVLGLRQNVRLVPPA